MFSCTASFYEYDGTILVACYATTPCSVSVCLSVSLVTPNMALAHPQVIAHDCPTLAFLSSGWRPNSKSWLAANGFFWRSDAVVEGEICVCPRPCRAVHVIDWLPLWKTLDFFSLSDFNLIASGFKSYYCVRFNQWPVILHFYCNISFSFLSIDTNISVRKKNFAL